MYVFDPYDPKSLLNLWGWLWLSRDCVNSANASLGIGIQVET